MNLEKINTMRPLLRRRRASKSSDNKGENVSGSNTADPCTRPRMHLSLAPFRMIQLHSIAAVLAVTFACLEIRSVGAFVQSSIYPNNKQQYHLPTSFGISPIQRHPWRRIYRSSLKSMHINNELSSAPQFTNTAVNGTSKSFDRGSLLLNALLLHDEDIARPTENGGYTHTTSSRAKISAANRGKTPWNKGKDRPEETKAKIAAGVRARIRQRFLEKLQAMGVTEEEYNEQQEQEKERKRQEMLARRTEKGGYRPTKETRQKISQILKEKHANGLVKRRSVDPANVRRGFTHTEETRRKISETLRKRWATDEKYRENMKEKAQKGNSDIETRKRISETLKAKWKDEEFRAIMLSKMSNRKQRVPALNEKHRKNISDAMKTKWQDEEYRQKTLEAIAKRRDTLVASRPPKPPRAKASKPRKAREKSEKEQMGIVARQVLPRTIPRQEKTRTKATDNKASPATPIERKLAPLSPTAVTAAKPLALISEPKPKKAARTTTTTKKKEKKKTNGDVTQLREDRRDLFDLLYGDDVSHNEKIKSIFEDEDLEDFDPYGLEND